MTRIAPITGMLLIRKSHMRTRPRCYFRARRSAGRCGPTVLTSLAALSVTAKVVTNSGYRVMYTSSSPPIRSSCATCSGQPSTGEQSASTTARGGSQHKRKRISLLSSHATRSTESPEALPTERCIRNCCIRMLHGMQSRSRSTMRSYVGISVRTSAITHFQPCPRQTRNASNRPSKAACEQLSCS